MSKNKNGRRRLPTRCCLRCDEPFCGRQRCKHCDVWDFVARMRAKDFVPVPRRVKRAITSSGGFVVHGPISYSRYGNWAPRWLAQMLALGSRHPPWRGRGLNELARRLLEPRPVKAA